MANLLKLSEATALALHVMVIIARTQAPTSAAPMAKQLQASEAHVVKVLQQLVRAGLLQSKRGPGGGYALARPAREVVLMGVYRVFEGPMRNDGCLFSEPVCGQLNCILGSLVEDTRKRVIQHFSETTLEQAARD